VVKKPHDDGSFSDEEIASRRDEVIRRMANTPPQPNGKPKHHRRGKRKPTAAGRAVHKGRARREPSTET
jgi:hypothetical protein